MKRSKFIVIVLALLVSFSLLSQEQTFQFNNGKTSDKIRFQLINNLIVIPIAINGVTLSFILDSGVTKPILFEHISSLEVLNSETKETFFLKGLGDGYVVEAIKSTQNKIEIGKAVKYQQTIYAIFDGSMDYTPKLGIPIHGIIGYDVFKDFVVEINYRSKYIKLLNPDTYKEKSCRNCEKIALSFYNLKPYITAQIRIEGKDIPVKMLLDTGASDALWLFEDASQQIVSTDNYFDDFLGYGLSGALYGKRSKVENLTIGNFVLNESLVAFPIGESIETLKKYKDRNGTIGAEILKRFHVTFNYQDSYMVIKKNANFKKPFSYNKSGIDIEHNGIRLVKNYYYTLDNGRLLYGKNTDVTKHISNKSPYDDYRLKTVPAFEIVKIRPNSPAQLAGLQLGDFILEVNGTDVKRYSLQELIHLFKGPDGKRIRIRIERDGKLFKYEFNLNNLLN
ncbi:PDZ domain-containing protein [Bizionia argentinensis JUB59]|uniref:PDZ domain-containing protein n=1 Tax=Bizionia argentinensis JUB59 TaxID=1046627 RepID=G2EBP5_9FLAO|nr:PDZ domain-containing protein [Bizionia argentinensis]EGV44200.1 PDZ domain-containing protein [Bizionia argentinensis JUB59]